MFTQSAMEFVAIIEKVIKDEHPQIEFGFQVKPMNLLSYLCNLLFSSAQSIRVLTRYRCRQIYPATFPQISDLVGKFSILIPWQRNQGHFNVVVNLSVLTSVSGNRCAAKEGCISLNPQPSVCIQSLALLKSVCIKSLDMPKFVYIKASAWRRNHDK